MYSRSVEMDVDEYSGITDTVEIGADSNDLGSRESGWSNETPQTHNVAVTSSVTGNEAIEEKALADDEVAAAEMGLQKDDVVDTRLESGDDASTEDAGAEMSWEMVSGQKPSNDVEKEGTADNNSKEEGDKAELANEPEVKQQQPKPKQAAKLRRRGPADGRHILKFTIAVVLACVIVVGATFGLLAFSDRQASGNPYSGPCQEGQVKEINDNALVVSLIGLDNELSAEEAHRVTQAVTDAYNVVSGRCSDVFERWMFKTWVTSQEIIQDNDNVTLSVAIVAAVSCDGCPLPEAFASLFDSSALYFDSRTLQEDPSPSLTMGSANRNRALEENTVNATEFFYQLEEELSWAAWYNELPSGYEGLEFLEIDIANTKRKYRYYW